jgi:hypothetical protein
VGLPYAGPQCPGFYDSRRLDHPHLPKDNEEVITHVKRLYAILDTAMVADPVHDQEDGAQGHKDDHRQSPRGDLTSSITRPEEHG